MRDFTVVFDLDGTLIDTAPDLMGAVDRLLAEKGLRSTPQDLIKPLISYGSRVMLKRALEFNRHEIDDVTFESWWQRYLEIYVDNIAVHSRPFPGLLSLLDRLQEQGATLAVCTNKMEQMSRDLLSALELSSRFAAIAGRDTFPDCFKPHPEHILGVIRQAGGSPTRAVMVGDSDVDIAAARNAGVPVIGVTFGYVHAPIETFSPDAVIDHYDAFDAALAGILKR